jgi:hypothetical protein
MNDMDLVPGEFRRGLTLRRNLRHFMWALVLLLGILVATRATLGYLIWREKAQVVSLEQQQQVISKTQTEAESLRQQRLVTEQQLATLDLLQGNDLVQYFLQSIDEAYTEHIWLDSVHFQRRENTGPPAIGATAGAAEDQTASTAVDLLHDAELVGHASNHSYLATFMQQLGGQPVVADLRLINTATRTYASAQVIDFKLALQIRGKERR